MVQLQRQLNLEREFSNPKNIFQIEIYYFYLAQYYELKENSWPTEYHFIEKLPTTGAGKIDFRTLEKWAENSDSF